MVVKDLFFFATNFTNFHE